MIIFQKTKYYIFFNFFKYLLATSLFFIFLIWISQTLKIFSVQLSDPLEILDILIISVNILPSYFSPLFPLLIIFSSIALSYKLINTNEIFIFRIYIDKINFLKIFISISLIVLIFFLFNKEVFGPKTYKIYKEKELDIRNKLKLGFQNKNEFHIGEDLSLFFEFSDKNNFKNVNAIIYNENKFIKSNNAILEFNENTLNIIFSDGERVILNNNEKSFTKFEKFTYSIKNEKIEKLLYDKEHFTTLELLKSNEREFITQGHNSIYQYFFLISILLISQRLIFMNNKNNYKKNNILAIFSVLTLIVINSFLQYALNNNFLFTQFYYVLIFMATLILTFFIFYKNEIE